MRKIIQLFFLINLIFSCTEKKQELTNNQKQIINYYNKIDKFIKINNDSVKYFSNKLEEVSQNETNEFKAITMVAKSISDINLGLYDLSIKNCNQTILVLKNSKNDSIKAKNFLSLALCKKYKGDLSQSLNFNFKALKLYENCNNKIGIAIANNKIADVYYIKNDIKNSIKFLNNALNALKDCQPENAVRLSTYHSMANIYGMSGNYKEALKIDDKCLKIVTKINSNKIKVMFLDNIANCFMYSNQLDSAQIYFDKCLILDKKIGDPNQIADNYSNQAILYSMKNDFPKAEQFALESVSILQKIDNKSNLLNSYQSLSDIYEKQGKLKQTIKVKNDFLNTYKSLINDKKEAATAEFQEIYESDKKDKQIVEQDAKSKQKNLYLFGLSLLVLFIGIISFLIYRQQRQKNQQQAKENELKSAIAEIESQNKLQEQRLSISRDLHDNIGSQLTFIISSVDNVKYGFDIQNEKLDLKLTNISSFAQDTIVELRDTIWAMNSNEISFEDLEIRINNYIEKARLSQEKVSFSFAIDETLKRQKLTSIEGMNIYRTIQEAVNNSLKYAQAEIISVNIKQKENQTKITITDNGKGFNITTIEKGNGLNNMKKRIEEIGGKFDLTSSSNGTRVEILV